MNAKIEALRRQISSGKMKTDSARILNYIIESKFCTTPDVEFKFAMKHQTASARLADLEDMGIVEKNGTVETQSGTHSLYKYQSNPIKMAQNAHERKMLKFNVWMKKGKENFKELITQETVQMLVG